MDLNNINELEAIIDKNSLEMVLEELIEICQNKADHLASNWQDVSGEKTWSKAAKILDACRAKVSHLGI